MSYDSVMRWFGGKFYLLNKLFPFPKHTIFVDVFGGSGVVILNKIPATCDVYNDINKNLFNLFMSLKNRFHDFIFASKIVGGFDSKAIWDWAREELDKMPSVPENEIDIQRAVLFYYVQATSFSGLGNTHHGLHSELKNKPFNAYNAKINGGLDKFIDRIKQIVFECSDFRKLLKRDIIHRENSLIYLDPPYIKGGEMYERMSGGNEWTIDDLNEMIEMVRDTNAKVCISIDRDHKYFNLPDSKWNSEMVVLPQRAGYKTEGCNDRVEYIIRNYDQKTCPKQIAQKSLTTYL